MLTPAGKPAALADGRIYTAEQALGMATWNGAETFGLRLIAQRSLDDGDPSLLELADVISVDRTVLTPETRLTDGNWDSISVLSTIALIDQHFGITVSGRGLAKCESVADVLELVRISIGGIA